MAVHYRNAPHRREMPMWVLVAMTAVGSAGFGAAVAYLLAGAR